MIIPRELRLAAKAAAPFLPATLEDFKPTPRKHLPVGVYSHASRFRTNIKQPDGTWKLVSFATAQEASAARAESIKP